jgi:hypothetical protein
MTDRKWEVLSAAIVAAVPLQSSQLTRAAAEAEALREYAAAVGWDPEDAMKALRMGRTVQEIRELMSSGPAGTRQVLQRLIAVNVKVHAVRELHQQEIDGGGLGTGLCQECGKPSPCPTLLALPRDPA